MLRSIALCGVALSGALAQFTETSGVPSGLSPRCEAGLRGQIRDIELQMSQGAYQRMYDLMCTSVSLVPNFSPAEPYEITPCNQGIEFIQDTCPASGGFVCEVDVFQRVTNTSNMVRQHQLIQLGVCLPQECTTEDYTRYVESREDIIRGVVQAAFPAPTYSVDVSGAMLCRQNDLPANFGTGFQTAVVVGGVQIANDSTFTLSCMEGCSPNWSVDVDVITLMTPTEVGALFAALLNENQAFGQSGCLAKYAILRGNADTYGDATEGLNIFCPDNAQILISQDGGAAAMITAFTSSDRMTFVGSSSAFDSDAPVTANSDGSGVSAVAPGVTLLIASLASVAALAH